MAMMEGTIAVGAASVRWRRDGAGPALVFLHGFPLSGETWDGVVAYLRDRFTCWTLDLIGLGGSSSTADDDYASPGQARAFAAVLSELGVGSYALVGNDTGGWIARELALVDRQRVARLVLTSTEIPGVNGLANRSSWPAKASRRSVRVTSREAIDTSSRYSELSATK